MEGRKEEGKIGLRRSGGGRNRRKRERERKREEWKEEGEKLEKEEGEEGGSIFLAMWMTKL